MSKHFKVPMKQSMATTPACSSGKRRQANHITLLDCWGPIRPALHCDPMFAHCVHIQNGTKPFLTCPGEQLPPPVGVEGRHCRPSYRSSPQGWGEQAKTKSYSTMALPVLSDACFMRSRACGLPWASALSLRRPCASWPREAAARLEQVPAA